MSRKSKLVIVLCSVLLLVTEIVLYLVMFNFRTLPLFDSITSSLIAVSVMIFAYVQSNQVNTQNRNVYFKYLMINVGIMILGGLIAALINLWIKYLLL